MAGKFEVYQDRSGKFRFRLKAGNGEIIATGESYESKSGAMNGVESVNRLTHDKKGTVCTEAPQGNVGHGWLPEGSPRGANHLQRARSKKKVPQLGTRSPRDGSHKTSPSSCSLPGAALQAARPLPRMRCAHRRPHRRRGSPVPRHHSSGMTSTLPRSMVVDTGYSVRVMPKGKLLTRRLPPSPRGCALSRSCACDPFG